jgi:hypothetical protein
MNLPIRKGQQIEIMSVITLLVWSGLLTAPCISKIRKIGGYYLSVLLYWEKIFNFGQ